MRSYVVDDTGTVVRMTIATGEPDAGTYLPVWNGHGDALNLSRLNTDGSLTLANSYRYATWGRPETATHNGIGDLGFRYLYVGEFDVQWDDQLGLGLLYMHARHYSPELGRFVQPDPDRSEANLYAYAADNPVTEMDPDGTCFIVCVVIIGAILFGALGATAEVTTYAVETPRRAWTADGARDAAFRGGVGGAIGGAAGPVGGRILGRVAAKILAKVPKAARAPRWTTDTRSRPTLNRSASNNTAQKVLDRAKSGPGGKTCSTCPRTLPPWSPGTPRRWDVDHIIKWRTLRPVARALERVAPGSGRRIYNLPVLLRARCQACNRADQ